MFTLAPPLRKLARDSQDRRPKSCKQAHVSCPLCYPGRCHHRRGQILRGDQQLLGSRADSSRPRTCGWGLAGRAAPWRLASWCRNAHSHPRCAAEDILRPCHAAPGRSPACGRGRGLTAGALGLHPSPRRGASHTTSHLSCEQSPGLLRSRTLSFIPRASRYLPHRK